MGPTMRRWFRVGYVEALTDILVKLDDGGEDAARQWIADNT